MENSPVLHMYNVYFSQPKVVNFPVYGSCTISFGMLLPSIIYLTKSWQFILPCIYPYELILIVPNRFKQKLIVWQG